MRTQIILPAKKAYYTTYFKKLIQNSSYSECDPNLRTMKTFRSFLNFKSVEILTVFVVLLLCCLDFSTAKFTPLEIDNHPCTPENLKVITLDTFFDKFQKFLEDSVDVFYGTRSLKSIDYSKKN